MLLNKGRMAGNAKDLMDKLIQHVVAPLRGKRSYAQELINLIARVGSAPSAGGARIPIAAITSHVAGR